MLFWSPICLMPTREGGKKNNSINFLQTQALCPNLFATSFDTSTRQEAAYAVAGLSTDRLVGMRMPWPPTKPILDGCVLPAFSHEGHYLYLCLFS